MMKTWLPESFFFVVVENGLSSEQQVSRRSRTTDKVIKGFSFHSERPAQATSECNGRSDAICSLTK